MKKTHFLFKMCPLLLILIISSCNDKDQATQFYLNRIFFIEYVNVDRINILKNDSSIEIYYEKNGIAEIVERPNLDYPNGFTMTTKRNALVDGSDELCIKVFPSDYYNEENISTTFIKVSDHQMDTIQCQFISVPNVFYLTKIWLNGTLVWDMETKPSSRLIQIIK